MNRIGRLAGGLLFILISTIVAMAQQPTRTLQDRVIGTWLLSTIYDEYTDGRKVNPWGPAVKGMIIFDGKGRFSWQIFGSNRPKFASNNRREGTPEENKAVVQETQSYFGTYAVNDADSKIALHIERSLFPNWDGVDQTRAVKLEGDLMTYVANPIPSANGAFVPHLEFKRVP